MTGDTHRLPMDSCPRCGSKLDAATGIMGGAAEPKPDDLSVCLSCGAALQWDVQMRLQTLTLADLIALPKPVADRIRDAQNAVRDRQANAP